ncbi:MAG: hypothetical protein CVU64_04415 [Deltaproteobacteria bacterium HGW-Deltaproteobacteria-21]|nr:MAG: hypothetical protein CVU64_04415 [Deltaproteobacteria bacterium HGW-Deltaproteobacteria-21]
MNENCRYARYVNLLVGLILMGLGLVFAFTGLTIFPLIGFYFAVPVIVGSFYFLLAPSDKSCFVS